MDGDKEAVRIAVLPGPGMGHLIPFGELAKHLVSRHSISVTFITFAESTSISTQKAFLDALPPTITSLHLPPVSLADIPDDTRIETYLSMATLRSLPALRSILQTLQQSTRLAAFIADIGATDVLTVCKELGIPFFLFYPANLFSLSFFLHLPDLDASTTCEYRDLPEPLQLPGCVPVLGSDLPIAERSNDGYKCMVHFGRHLRDADGILVNTFKDIEPATAKIINKDDNKWPPVYLVGPLIQSHSPDIELANCLSWLDKQPRESVMLVSFGSVGTLTRAQMKELACGLEMSGQRFLWVVRSPSDTESYTKFVNSMRADDSVAFLPEGFVERTKNVGLMVQSWVPQLRVLAHRATGGFLSHCGWNSIVESVMHGVPMIVWPLFAEQRMNAVMLTEEVRVALRPLVAANGICKSEEIAKVVKALMEGEEGKRVREKAKELQKGRARSEEESCNVIGQLAGIWKTFVSNSNIMFLKDKNSSDTCA